MQYLAWAITDGHFGWTIEAIELEFDAMGRIGIVLPHPLHKFSICIELAEAVAKPEVLNSLIRCRAATDYVLIHYACPRETALDGDGAVAMRLHQALEKLVAEYKNVFAAVKCFSKAKQLHRVVK